MLGMKIKPCEEGTTLAPGESCGVTIVIPLLQPDSTQQLYPATAMPFIGKR